MGEKSEKPDFLSCLRSMDPTFLYGGLMSVFIYAQYGVSRLGFGDSPLTTHLPLLGLALSLFSLPPFFIAWMKKNSERTPGHVWMAKLPIPILLVGGLWLAAGVLKPLLGKFPLFLLGFLGSFFFLISWFEYFRHDPWRALGWTIAVGLFSVWMASTFWVTSYNDPLLTEELMIGIPRIDALFHGAMAQMILTYHIPSLGLNGPVFMPYHFGSHILVAFLARLTDVSPLHFYQLGFPVIFLPLFVVAAFQLARAYLEKNLNSSAAENLPSQLAILSFALVGFVPIKLIRALRADQFILSSESYLLGIIFSYLLLIFILEFFAARKSGTPAPLHHLKLAFVLLGSLLLIGFSKISIMVIGVGTYVYFLFRQPSLRWREKLVPFFVVSLLAVAFPLLYPKGSGALSLLRPDSPIFPSGWKIFQLPLTYFWPLFFISLRLYQELVKNKIPLARAWREGKLWDAELLLATCAFSFLPPLFMTFSGGSDQYFLTLPNFICFPLLMGLLSTPVFHSLFSWRNRIRAACFIPLSIFCGLNAVEMINAALHENTSVRAHILVQGGWYNDAVKNPHESVPAILMKKPVHYISGTKNFRVLQALEELAGKPEAVKKTSLLYIPPTVRSYWDMFPSGCRATPFTAPAISGISLLHGFDAGKCEYAGYGYDRYEGMLNAPPKLLRDAKQLCAAVQMKGMSSVFILSEQNGNVTTEHLSCDK